MSRKLRITIQPLSQHDLTSVKALFDVCIHSTFIQENLLHLSDVCQSEIQYKCALIDDALGPKQRGFRFWVARTNDQIVGIISYGPCGEDIIKASKGTLAHLGEVGSLYVLPEYQNRGVGSALIQAVLVELAREGISQFVLDSGYRLAQARWKRKFGDPWIEIPDYWGPAMPHCVWRCQTAEFLVDTDEE